MVPIKDYNPVRTTPYVTYGLIALNVLIFFYEITLPPNALSSFFNAWAVIPEQLSDSFQTGFSVVNAEEWLTLITAQFLHGGILHLGGNMLYLYIFGNNVEDQLGRAKFLFFYITCGLLANLVQWFFAPESGIPSLGASGAIAGVMGAYIFRFPEVRILTIVPLGPLPLPLQIPAIFYLGFWFLQQALYGTASLQARTMIGMEGGGIAYWAHAGGFLIGALIGPALGLFDKANQDSESEFAQSPDNQPQSEPPDM